MIRLKNSKADENHKEILGRKDSVSIIEITTNLPANTSADYGT
ncbi:MAG TPA: hypothetical protein VJW95_01590 [Dissulfurispiraceae bacterium]|nr:hypothetical protein [Dissulfurispiraceae bacterium]